MNDQNTSVGRTPGMTHIEPFIARWKDREGGQERANYALFLSELCDVLGVARPDPANADTETNDYVFERVVSMFGEGLATAIRETTDEQETHVVPL